MGYNGKFSFKSNKNKLIEDNNLKEYFFFTNNAIVSFNHLINEYVSLNSKNSKVSFDKFEDMIKFIFIRMEGIDNKNSYVKGISWKRLWKKK